jgi:rubrerythrin
MRSKNHPPGTPIDILTAALQKEREAYAFYNRLISGSTVMVVQELLEQLRDEEHKHILLIEDKIARLKGVS